MILSRTQREYHYYPKIVFIVITVCCAGSMDLVKIYEWFLSIGFQAFLREGLPYKY